MKILFYLIKDRLSPRGGPLGVGYYYEKEQQKRNLSIIDFLESDSTYENIHLAGRLLTQHFPAWLNSIHRNIRGARNLKKFLENEPMKTSVHLDQYDAVFFHETKDLYKEKKNLESYNGAVILQSHSPLPLWQEQTTDLPDIYFKMIPNLKEKLSKIDEYAFRRADYIVFPCEDAEEPYLSSWNLYQKIHEDRKEHYRYITTGIAPVSAKRDRLSIQEELSIPKDSFIVSYAGRHNTVKGYDLLKDIGKVFLSLDNHNYIIVAGRIGPIKEPYYKNWIEIGWTTDPHSYIAASDVFILPNRVTYFDLILIEVMSLGKIALVSRTGGNKFFEKAGTKGIFFYETKEEAIEKLNDIKAMTPEERTKLGNENKAFYEKHLTVASMFNQFEDLVKEIDSSRKNGK